MSNEEIKILELYQDKDFFDKAFKNVSKEELKIKLHKNYMKQLDLQSQLDIANKKLDKINKKIHNYKANALNGIIEFQSQKGNAKYIQGFSVKAYYDLLLELYDEYLKIIGGE